MALTPEQDKLRAALQAVGEDARAHTIAELGELVEGAALDVDLDTRPKADLVAEIWRALGEATGGDLSSPTTAEAPPDGDDQVEGDQAPADDQAPAEAVRPDAIVGEGGEVVELPPAPPAAAVASAPPGLGASPFGPSPATLQPDGAADRFYVPTLRPGEQAPPSNQPAHRPVPPQGSIDVPTIRPGGPTPQAGASAQGGPRRSAPSATGAPATIPPDGVAPPSATNVLAADVEKAHGLIRSIVLRARQLGDKEAAVLIADLAKHAAAVVDQLSAE